MAAALAVLLVFPLYFLRSFAYAGIGVVVIATVSALFVLPALLAVIGTRIDRGRMPWAKRAPSTTSAFWGRVAGAVTRRPILAAAAVVAVLLIAASPLLRVEFGTPDDRVLTTSRDSRAVGDVLRESFPGNDTKAIELVTSAGVTPDALSEYAERVSALPGVERVSTSVGLFAGGIPASPNSGDAALAGPEAELLLAATDADPRSAAARDLVRSIRAVEPPAGSEVLVGGNAATLMDSKAAIGDRLPLAAGLIALITFVVLYLFTGSIVQPLRALVFNVLSLSATLGLAVMVFQEGWLSTTFGFTPLPLDISMLVLLFCVAFGLSMDYEVFVLSRIKERHDAGADTVAAVTDGLSHSGRIVSAAAALLAVNFFAFGTSGVSFIQMFGIGTGVAILIDATLVRGVLVPASLKLLGPAAWWAPPSLRRFHDRVAISEAPYQEVKV